MWLGSDFVRVFALLTRLIPLYSKMSHQASKLNRPRRLSPFVSFEGGLADQRTAEVLNCCRLAPNQVVSSRQSLLQVAAVPIYVIC